MTKETGQFKNEHANRKERLPVLHREAIRTITLQMNPVAEIIAQLIPDPELVPDGMLPQCPINVTSTIMEVKNRHSLHPNDITPPGGAFEYKNDGKFGTIDEQMTIRAGEIIWQEFHLNPMRVTIHKNLKRVVDVRSARLFGKRKPGIQHTIEHWATCVASPMDHQVHVFPPRYKIKEAIRYSPENLKLFLKQEITPLSDGTTGRLLDSLSRFDERRHNHHVTTTYSKGQNEKTYRDALLRESALYEADMLNEVLRRLIVITRVNIPQNVIKMFTDISVAPPKDYDSAIRAIDSYQDIFAAIEREYASVDVSQHKTFRYIPQQIRTAYREKGISTNEMRVKDLFIRDVVSAYNQVTLTETIELTKNTMIQQQYLLAQLIPSLGILSHYEYDLLSKNAWIKHLIDVPLTVFGIDPTKPNWHMKLLHKLKEIQPWEFSQDGNRRRMYMEILNKMNMAFCKPKDKDVPAIKSPDLIGIRSLGANDYTEHLKNELAPVSTPEVRFLISTNPFSNSAHNILETVYRMWGLNQHNPECPIPRSEQTAAWTKLLHLLLDQKVNDIEIQATSISIKMMRRAVDVMLGDPIDGYVIGNHAYSKFRVQPAIIRLVSNYIHSEPIVMVDGNNIDLRSFSIPIVSNVRVKNTNEIKRKILERGNIGSGGPADLTDFIGMFFALDEGAFLHELFTKYPKMKHVTYTHTVEAVVSQWKRFAATVILRGIEKITQDTSPFPLTMTRDKGRCTTKILDGILPIDAHTAGSEASLEPFAWLKYVLHINNGEEEKDVEIQFFPDLTELQKKIEDDRRFHILRLFEKPTGRYPVIYLEFVTQEGFEKMLELIYEARDSERRRPKWVDWVAVAFLHIHDRLISTRSIIYERPR